MRLHPAASLILALGFAAPGLGGWLASRQALIGASAELDAIQARSLALKSELARAQGDEPAIRQNILRFKALTESGLIGPERRLEWSEALQAFQARAGLEEASFSLAPQTRLKPGQVLSPRRSGMEWQARLLHEGQFLALLDALPSIRSAIVWPSQCSLEALGPEKNASRTLEARCSFEWITLPGPDGGKP